MSVKIKDIQTRIIKENDNSYSVICSALGVYSSGKTKKEAETNYLKALELHLSVIKEKAIDIIRNWVNFHQFKEGY